MKYEINSYDLLGVKKDSSREDVLEAYMTLKHNLLLNKQQGKITEEEYNRENARLDNAYNSIINNEVVEVIDSNEKEETPEVIEEVKLDEVKEEPSSELLEQDLKTAIDADNVALITAKRGRLIKKIKDEIKKIKQSGELKTQDDIDDLKRLEDLLDEQIYEHKQQLSERYKEEFLDKPATVKAIFTVFPKGLGLQVKKISNCINELKQAKSNKERIFGVVDLAKSIGLLTATPIIFTAKFIVKHWYLLLLLLTLIPNLQLPNWLKSKLDKKSNEEKTEGEAELETVTDPEMEATVEKQIESIKQGIGETEKAIKTTTATIPATEPVKETATSTASKSVEPASYSRWGEAPGRQGVIDTSGMKERAATTATNTTNENVTNVASKTTAADTYQAADYLEDTSINTNFSGGGYNEPDLTDKYFQLVRESLPPIITKYNTIFNTYQDALNYCVNELHYSPEKAEAMLNNGLSSVKWLVGKNGLVAGSGLEMLQNYSLEQLQEMANSNQGAIDAAIELQNLGKSFSDICATLGAEGTIAFIAYELLQYGLAIPTSGLSLAMPG